jgi:GT2 family glycosyltransferase
LVKNKVSIVIVTHNSQATLERCLVSLQGGLAEVDHELVVVDNASSDGSGEIVKQQYPDATIVANEKNRGFAAACNQAVQETEGEFLLFVNPDVQMGPGSVQSMMALIRTDHKAGAITPRMRNLDGSFQPTCRRLPTIYNLLFSRGSVLSRLIGARHIYTLPDYAETKAVEAVAATVLLIRRSLFSRMKGFDERFFMYMEDTDLCYRLRTLGYRNYFVPTAGAVHDWGHGSDAGRLRRIWHHHFSVWKYFLKHLPNGFSLLVLPAILTLNMLLTIITPPYGRSGRR